MDVSLWEDLLNSDWHDYRGSGRREDRIDDPAWLERFTARWETWLEGVPTEEVRAALKRERRVIRAIVDRLASRRNVTEGSLAELDGLVSASPLVRRVGRRGGQSVEGGRKNPGLAHGRGREGPQSRVSLSLVPQRPGLQAVIAEIAASFAETLSSGDPSRIKVCDNRDCLWVFYDRSKNRSRRWCEGNTGCGNLMKVRRFRKKRETKKR